MTRRTAWGLVAVLVGLLLVAAGIYMFLQKNAVCGGRTMSADDRCVVTHVGRTTRETFEPPVTTTLELPPTDPGAYDNIRLGDRMPPMSTVTATVPAAGLPPAAKARRDHNSGLTLAVFGVVGVAVGLVMIQWRTLSITRRE